MSRSRWRPPPMNEPASEGQTDDKPKVRVDEQVVRKMLKVNPDMRKGRTTFQVKKALEGGEPVGGPSSEQAATSASTPASSAAVPAASAAAPAAGAPSPAAKELRDTIDFFVRGKAKSFDDALAEINARRKALDAEQKALEAQHAEQVTSFISLLDGATVAAHGKAALAAHAEFLKRIGLDIAALMQRVLRK